MIKKLLLQQTIINKINAQLKTIMLASKPSKAIKNYHIINATERIIENLLPTLETES